MDPTAKQPTKISIPDSLNRITNHWSPKVVASINNSYDMRIVKVSGDFVWHSHTDTDELFYVLAGNLTIKLREPGRDESNQLEDVFLATGDVTVIPKGMRHCPVTVAGEECSIMVIEPSGVVNTGDASDTRGLKNAVEVLHS
jgi:mannose-6-phosphate isomerase-like protein (cupin superfamily)